MERHEFETQQLEKKIYIYVYLSFKFFQQQHTITSNWKLTSGIWARVLVIIAVYCHFTDWIPIIQSRSCWNGLCRLLLLGVCKKCADFRLRKHPFTTNQTAKNGNRKLVSALEQQAIDLKLLAMLGLQAP